MKKHLTQSEFEAMRRNVILFAVYAAALAVVVFDIVVWRP
jgi:hypothetical protein